MTESKVRRKSKLRWGVEQRLEFIEFRLYWEGRMNRRDLMNVFGVSVNQASTDLNRYVRLAPENMVYDKSARTYVRTSVFSPLFFKEDAEEYLGQLRGVSEGSGDEEDAWIRTYPAYAGIPRPMRIVNPQTLQFVLDVMRRKRSMEILYQSLSRPEPRWRWVFPHAIGFDGFRWHVRAFCERTEAFKDFLLARIVDIGDEARDSECDPSEDRDWHEYVELRIGPHPGLSASQQRVVELDYGMHDGSVGLRVRRAFLFYTLKSLGFDGDAVTRDPARQHIVLLNRDELERVLPAEDAREGE